MTVIPLTRPSPPPVDTHTVLPAAARHAMVSLEARVGELRRIFAGPSAPVAQAARIEALANEIRSEAARLARWSR